MKTIIRIGCVAFFLNLTLTAHPTPIYADSVMITIRSNPPATLPTACTIVDVPDLNDQLEMSRQAAMLAMSTEGWGLEVYGGGLALFGPPEWTFDWHLIWKMDSEAEEVLGYELNPEALTYGGKYHLYFHNDEYTTRLSHEICERPDNFGVISGGMDGYWVQCTVPDWGEFTVDETIEFPDFDEDGYYDVECVGSDCDDTNPDVNPGVVEGAIDYPTCSDGIDNDCDGLIDTDPECISFLVPDEHPTIQAAINVAESGNTILVSPGIYRENIDFMGKDVKVHSVDGPVKTIIDGDRVGSVAVFTSGETEEAVLDGFTIKNGSGTFITLAPYIGFERYVGGGLYLENSSPTITNCMITNNYAFIGGGLYLRASTPTIMNSMIVRNRATGLSLGGGGIFLEDSSPTITHCTVGSNLAGQYGGAIFCYNASPRITNSILWGDSALYGSEIHVQSGSPVVTYSDVQGGWAGEGNIDLNPLFFGGGSYHIRAVSACVDAGTDAGVYTDFDGQDRPWGAGSDMGADEFSTEPCSVIASSGGQFFALYLIPILAFVFLGRRWMIKK